MQVPRALGYLSDSTAKIPGFQEMMPGNFITTYDALLLSIFSDYPNVLNRDYSGLVLDQEMYHNQDHVNRSGAIIVSKQFLDDLREPSFDSGQLQ